jgi:hypothetical protein
MTRTVEITCIRQRNNDLYESGIDDSIASISLLKRFIILPTGVCSKKLILLRRIENNMELCNPRADLINISIKIQSANKYNKPKQIKNKTNKTS